MQVTSTPVTATPNVDETDPLVVRTGKKSLGQDDFLKLLTKQLATQDPLKPMEDTAFIAQMAQFSSLEQSSQLNREFAKLRASTDLSGANSLIGRQVTVLNADGEEVTGKVSAVDTSTDTTRLMIDGTPYDYASVKKVEAAPVPSTSPTP